MTAGSGTPPGDAPDRPTVPPLRVLVLGRVDYAATVERMRAFTGSRSADTPDEIWLCEHDPVYTQGLAGRPDHVLDAHGIPVVATNRGGQVTYHGPGQVVAYPLVDLRRLGIYVKEFVYRLEQAVIQTLDAEGVTGLRVTGAPGIYVRLADPGGHAVRPRGTGPDFDGLGKIAALGIKVSNHRSYHGLALNVAMDLSPYDGINPCGYPGLRTVDLATLGVHSDWDSAARRLGDRLAALLTP
jgi:lipoyl(octanoyl) transferase